MFFPCPKTETNPASVTPYFFKSKYKVRSLVSESHTTVYRVEKKKKCFPVINLVSLPTAPASPFFMSLFHSTLLFFLPQLFLHIFLLVVVFAPLRFMALTFRHRASCILGQAFHYSPENAFYIFNQQIYFII